MDSLICDICHKPVKPPSEVFWINEEKMIHSSCASCVVCGKKKEERASYKSDLVIIEGKIIHANECLKCAGCEKTDWRLYCSVTVDDKIYHNDDMKRYDISGYSSFNTRCCVPCPTCGKFGVLYHANEKNVHPECRTCAKCGEVLGEEGKTIPVGIEKVCHRSCVTCSADYCELSKAKDKHHRKNDFIYYDDMGLPFHGSCFPCSECEGVKPSGKKRKLKVDKERCIVKNLEGLLVHSDCMRCEKCNNITSDQHVKKRRKKHDYQARMIYSHENCM